MATRTTKNYPLPEWFKLEKYDDFKNQRCLVVFEEFYERCRALKDGGCALEDVIESLSDGLVIFDDYNYPDDEKYPPMMGMFKALSVGPEPKIVKYEKRNEPIEFAQQPLPDSENVKPVNILDLASMYLQTEQLGLTKTQTSQNGNFISINTDEHLSSISKAINHRKIVVSLNLEQTNDKDLIDEISNLLPLWREKMNIREITPPDSPTKSVIRKIITYHAIPMLDLMLWGKYKDFEYTARQLSEILFPNDLTAEKKITDTKKPFINDYTYINNGNDVRDWLNQYENKNTLNRDLIVKDIL